VQVVGIDGCRQGWVAIRLDDGAFAGAEVHPKFSEIVSHYPGAAVLGVDIPVGLLDTGWRDCDHDARAFLGKRASAVFPTPPRPVLAAEAHDEATALARELAGKGISQQSFALARKILEVDAVAADARIYEVHPEVAFQVMAGRSLSHSKRTWAGVADRLALVRAAGIDVPTELGSAGALPPDDVLDAAAVAWTAHRIATGGARSFPADPGQRDGDRIIAIWA
jgi:predicted RNase H-like nuclease